jgi:DNA polymerase-3 subunit delta'
VFFGSYLPKRHLFYLIRSKIQGMNWDLAGHDWAVALLKEHLVRQQVHQAYLFTGPAGVGRHTLALRFAQAIECPHPRQPGEPCRTCRTCVQIERCQYPDLDIVQVEGGSREIKIDQVRALQHRLSLAPYGPGHRIALLLNFQNANPNAQNALLKTLEEAPEKVILLLTADTPEGLLPTIMSRCEILRLRPLPPEEAFRYLGSLDGVDAPKARRLAYLSGGRVGYARHLLENPGELEKYDATLQKLFELTGASRRVRFAYAEQLTREWGKGRDNLYQAMQVWLSLWRDVLLSAGGANAPLVNVDHTSEVVALAARIDVPTARRTVSALEDGLEKLEANANPRLLAEVLLMGMPTRR